MKNVLNDIIETWSSSDDGNSNNLAKDLIGLQYKTLNFD